MSKMTDAMRARFWELKDEVDAAEPEVTALREKFNEAHAEFFERYEREVRPLAQAARDREAELGLLEKKQEMAEITKFLRDKTTGIARMGPRPT